MDTARTARILLAEDEGKVGRPVVDRLRADGHDVRWVRTLRETRDALQEGPADILVLDLTLENDPLEFFQALRHTAQNPSGGVVVLVERADVRGRERAHQLGAAAVLAKPLQADEVADAVARLAVHL